LSNGWRALRRRVLTPDVSETSLAKRGFHRKTAAAQELLETVGSVFLTGYGNAVEARSTGDAAQKLDDVPTRFRGFAYEGAAMGYGMLDGLFGGRGRTDQFLAGPGKTHNYMVYVGVGWAMARLPRFRWPSAEPMDPLLRWLALDGYGFHQAYFRTQMYVREHYRNPRFPWPGGVSGSYANQAIDQGIGRALWFVCGTDVDLTAKAIGSFEPARRADLYSGAGLAATYAGGADAGELRRLLDHAGAHRGDLAQGSAFAAEARLRAGLVVPHTEVAVDVLCGTDVAHAARITQDVRPAEAVDREVPAYETWRRRIAREVIALRGVAT